jgi:hypothetical protein
MSKTELRIIWCGILIAIAAIAFPPFGYNRYEEILYNSSAQGLDRSSKIETAPWECVGLSFILSPPHATRILKMQDPSSKDIDVFGFTKPYVRIMPHVLLAEIAVIALVSAGAFITARKRSGSKVKRQLTLN